VLVLVADGNPDVGDTTRRAIERFGYRCTVAADGAEAWERIVSDRPDVILASLDLANVSGLEICHRIRERLAGPPTYVVAMVDDEDGEGLFAAMSGGADDFVVWPPRTEQLHARLQVAERFLLIARQQGDSQHELELTQRALRASARTDTLTRLWNRLQLNDDLDLFQGQLQRYGHRYAATLIDLDRFRAYNDANGQLAGDEALRVVAETISRQLRTGDRAYRYGGDELVVLLPEQTTESARVAAERIREAIDALALPHLGNPPWHLVTVSAGVAAFRPDGPSTYDALLGRAEAALLTAKTEGGNRVSLAP
jgi:two-component system chemotaxis family response regulator WspR